MTVSGLIGLWQKFWFTPESPLSLCVFRIVFGLVFLTQIATQYWTDFSVFFGEHPFIPHDDFVAFWSKKSVTINLFELLPTEDFWHIAFFVVLGIFTVMMIIGFCTRLSIILVFLGYASICHQYPFLMNAGDNMQRVVLFLLCFSGAGDCLSVDTYLKNRKGDWRKALLDPPPSPAWTTRMMQVQLAIAYITTALLKINSPIWFFGDGVYIATRLNDFVKLRVPIVFEHRISLYLMSWLTIIVEFAAGTLIWIKETKYWVILLGVILHVGIDWTMNIPIFEFAFMSIYILFIDSEDMKKLGRWLKLFCRCFYKKKAYISS